MNIPLSLELGPLFIASLIGSPHCLGMCGGFVALYSAEKHGTIWSHLLYNGGRLITYLVLGAAVATVTRHVSGTLLTLGLPTLQILIPFLFIVGAAAHILFPERVNSFLYRVTPRPPKALGAATGAILRSTHSGLKPFLIGAVTTLLPCGWLYLFVGFAAAQESVKSALLVMLVFWFGTVPILITAGFASRKIISLLGLSHRRIAAGLVLVTGVFSLYQHLSHSTHHHSHHDHQAHIH